MSELLQSGGAVLQAIGVCKNYLSGSQKLEVLRGVDLEIAAGESVSITGESGSGKSTLLNLLAGLDAPDAGHIFWGGSPDTGTRRRGAYLGMVFQAFYLVPEIDALNNVLLARRIAGPLDAASRTRARDLLARVGLAERLTHLPSQLSGGERQRVALARAVMNSPKLILADEPTGNLDERSAEGVIELLLSLCADMRTSLILVTHNPTHARKMRRTLAMRDGRLG